MEKCRENPSVGREHVLYVKGNYVDRKGHRVPSELPL